MSIGNYKQAKLTIPSESAIMGECFALLSKLTLPLSHSQPTQRESKSSALIILPRINIHLRYRNLNDIKLQVNTSAYRIVSIANICLIRVTLSLLPSSKF